MQLVNHAGFFDIITSPLTYLFWSIAISGPLLIISEIYKVINFFSADLIVKYIFGINENFSFNGLPPAFYGFVIAAASLWAIVFGINFIVLYFKKTEEFAQTFILSLRNSVLFILVLLLIPIFFFVFGIFINGFNLLIPKLFGADGQTKNIADILYYVGNTAGQTSGDLNGNYAPPVDIYNWSVGITFIITIIMLVILILALITVITKIVEIILLFFISPLVSVSMIFDNGKRLLMWKDMVLSKFLSISALLFAYNFFPILLTSISEAIAPNADTILYTITVAFLAIGLSLSMMAFGNIVASLIGEQTGIRESINGIGNMMRLGTSLYAGSRIAGLMATKTGAFALGGKKWSSKIPNIFKSSTKAGIRSGGTQLAEDMFNYTPPVISGGLLGMITRISNPKNQMDYLKNKRQAKINKFQTKDYNNKISEIAKKMNVDESLVRSKMNVYKVQELEKDFQNYAKEFGIISKKNKKGDQ